MYGMMKRPTKKQRYLRRKKARDLGETIGVLPSRKTEAEKDEIARSYLRKHYGGNRVVPNLKLRQQFNVD
jgi:hypothetical protein